MCGSLQLEHGATAQRTEELQTDGVAQCLARQMQYLHVTSVDIKVIAFDHRVQLRNFALTRSLLYYCSRAAAQINIARWGHSRSLLMLSHGAPPKRRQASYMQCQTASILRLYNKHLSGTTGEPTIELH